MEPIRFVRSRTVVMPTTDIDTDQIIPARFLTTTSKDGLGKQLFHDLRYETNGALVEDFALNTAAAKGCEILIAGNNFGCGSSREHAPWALLDYGIKVVISTEIADIFRSNALKNGLVPIVVDVTTHQKLLQQPGLELVIDLESLTVATTDAPLFKFEIDGFSRHCLLQGIDQLGFLQQQLPVIEQFEEARSWKP